MPETNEFLGDGSCFLTKGNPSARPASPAAAKAMISSMKSSVLKNRHRDFTRYLALPINFFTLVETEPWDRTHRPGGWRKTDQPTDDIPCFARNNHKAWEMKQVLSQNKGVEARMKLRLLVNQLDLEQQKAPC